MAGRNGGQHLRTTGVKMFRNLLKRNRPVASADVTRWLDADTAALIRRTAETLDNARKSA